MTRPIAPDDEGVELEGRGTVRIGRADDNDLALDDLRVSRHHAELRLHADGTYEVADLRSANGTFVNGKRVRGATVAPGDFIGVGGALLQLHDGRLRVIGARRSSWFGARDLVVEVDGKRILDEVGFALEPSSVLAVVGPSGSGKSTLLNALTGFRPADSGNVVFEGRDLYANYEDVRLRMGFVPQADILHTQLTVRQALRYEAELRFPRDVTKATRERRVDDVMSELNLTERANVRIDRLSGGQRKRVSVGCELLTEPSLLFLDEPTSGLDPGNEAALMETLRDLARAGRTIVVVTHSVQSLDLCDRLLVLAPGGRLAFYGRPADALPYFAAQGAQPTFPDMFRTLEGHRDSDWKATFRASQGYADLVEAPLASADLVPVPARPNIDAPPPTTPVLHQLGVLVRRYLAVIRSDRGFVIALALQAPIFGVLFLLMYGYNVMKTTEALNASVLIWLVVLGATWLGTSNAIREIVKELPIYRRERAIGLSAGAYLTSKVIVIGLITALQIAVLVPIALFAQVLPPSGADSQQLLAYLQASGYSFQVPAFEIAQTGNVLPSQLAELMVVAIVVGLASMALGLLVSAAAGGLDRASTVLPLLLVAQVIVSAPLFTKGNVALRSAGYLLPSQWGISAAASTVDLLDVRRPYLLVNETVRGNDISDLNAFEQAGWRHSTSAWIADMGVLSLLTLGGLFAAWYFLLRTDPNLMSPSRRRARAAPPQRASISATG